MICGTGTSQKGESRKRMLHTLGMKDGFFKHISRPVYRDDLRVEIREVQNSFSAETFYDLNHLMPKQTACFRPAQMFKTLLIFVPEIKEGLRMRRYLM